jgi:hypothetical protein
VRADSLEPILVTLFLVIESIAGYPVPEIHPSVEALPREQIAEIVCGRPCMVRAVYLKDRGVLIDDALDIRRDAFGQSVLAHELVHYLQDRNGAFSEMAPCKRQSALEHEAYWVQDEYMRRVTGEGIIAMHYSNRLWPRCFDEEPE